MGAAARFPAAQSGRHDAGPGRRRPAGCAGRHDHRRISRRDARRRVRRAPVAAAPGAARVEVRRLRTGSTTNSSTRSTVRWSPSASTSRHMRTEQGGGPPDTAPSVRRGTISAIISPISAGSCSPRLARRRAAELCRSGRGRAPVGGRLSGRCAVERRRSRKDLVRAGEVAPVVPAAAGRELCRASRRRRPTRTSTSERSETSRRRSREAAREHGFDAVGVARPDATPMRSRTSSVSSPKARMATWTGSPTTAERRTDPRRCGRTCAR